MNDTEFLSYILSAADDGISVNAEQANRLRALAGITGGREFQPGWWGTLDYDAVEKAVLQARANLRKPLIPA